MRKTRSDAILLNLPEEQQAKLADWLLSGVPYHEAKVLAEKEFGISLKSLAPFQSFWREVCAPALLARRRRAVSTADIRAEEAGKNPAQFNRATLDALEQKAYELAESPEADPKEVKAVMTLLLKAQDQDIRREQLALEREKFEEMKRKAAQADQAKGVMENKELSIKQREARMKEIFGIA